MAIETKGNRHRARVLVGGERKLLGSFSTREEAEEFESALAHAAPLTGPTLRVHGADWLDKRELQDEIRSSGDDRSRWRCHIETASHRSVRRRDHARGHRDLDRRPQDKEDRRLPRHASSLGPHDQKTIQLLKQCFDAAIPKYLSANPVSLVRGETRKTATKRRASEATDPWTYLVPSEQDAIMQCEAIPEPHRLMIAFALLTGMREGEQRQGWHQVYHPRTFNVRPNLRNPLL